jgi:hypothetical protein
MDSELSSVSAIKNIDQELAEGSTPAFDSIELGATDTTVERASAGDVNIEGNIIYRAGGTDVPVSDGGTGVSTLTNGGVLLGSGTGAITAMAVLTNGQMIVGDGTTDPVAESGATLRTSIGVGTGDNVTFTNLTTTGTNTLGNGSADSLTIAGSITASGIIDGGPNQLILGDKDGNVGGARLIINQTGTAQFASSNVIVGQVDGALNDLHVTRNITGSSNISSSGTVTGATGSFDVITGDSSVGTSLEVAGPITGSSFQGTKHILKAEAFYVNDDPMVQNSLYFGGTLGHQNSNWNDPQAAGGAISSTNSFTIAEDDMNWGYILPFDVSAVEVQCSLRPAGGSGVTGDDFSLAIYTANRSNDSNTNITLTKVAHQSDTFNNANYATNDLTYTGDLVKGTMIFVGVGTETSGTIAKNARGIMNITIVAR